MDRLYAFKKYLTENFEHSQSIAKEVIEENLANQ